MSPCYRRRSGCLQIAFAWAIGLFIRGDRCAETVLAAMEAAKDVDWVAARRRIEHGDCVLADLVPRAARLGAVVVQNPTHFTIGELLVERFGAQHRYMPLRSLLQAGVRLALGSDGPMKRYHRANGPALS
jgi:predicted amidohydrolase YtcJ